MAIFNSYIDLPEGRSVAPDSVQVIEVHTSLASGWKNST